MSQPNIPVQSVTCERSPTWRGRALLVLAGLLASTLLFGIWPSRGEVAMTLRVLPFALALLCGVAKSGTA